MRSFAQMEDNESTVGKNHFKNCQIKGTKWVQEFGMGRWHDYAKSGMVMLKSYTWSCRRLEVWHMVRATMHDRAKSYFLPFFRASSRIVA